jgi:hypothetical protein
VLPNQADAFLPRPATNRDFSGHRALLGLELRGITPTPIDHYPRTQCRSPMDMMRHAWLISLFHA